MNKIELAKAELIDTIGRYNLTVNNVAKMQFNKRETDLFANMMVEFADKLNNAKNGTTDNCNIPIVSNAVCDHRYYAKSGRYMLYENWCEKCGTNI